MPVNDQNLTRSKGWEKYQVLNRWTSRFPEALCIFVVRFCIFVHGCLVLCCINDPSILDVSKVIRDTGLLDSCQLVKTFRKDTQKVSTRHYYGKKGYGRAMVKSPKSRVIRLVVSTQWDERSTTFFSLTSLVEQNKKWVRSPPRPTETPEKWYLEDDGFPSFLNWPPFFWGEFFLG